MSAAPIPESVRAKAATIRLLALDCDGVLTDGGVYVFDDGAEFRRFNIKDGLGLQRVMAAGIGVAIISSSVSTAVLHRAARLGIGEVHVGVKDKLALLDSLCQRLIIDPAQVAYIGDDLPDLAPMRRVGLPCAPADAVEAVRTAALFVTPSAGGHGAVRDVCDLLAPVSNQS